MSTEDRNSCDIAVEFMIACFIIYGIILVGQLAVGVLDADMNVKHDKMLRIEYIFPGYRIGYWLGEKA